MTARGAHHEDEQSERAVQGIDTIHENGPVERERFEVEDDFRNCILVCS